MEKMSEEGRRIFAVICGAVRLEVEFYHIISTLCEWRSQGKLEGIVLSTWKGELEKIPHLRRKLEYLDILVVETDPLDESEDKYTNLNYVRQALQLRAGLEKIPEDVFVLKCRTDFCVNDLRRIESALGADLRVSGYGSFMPPVRYRIAILVGSVSLPFWFNDIVFVGHKMDVRKLLRFEDTVKSVGRRENPDILWWISLFWHDYPILQEYISTVNMWATNEIMKKYLNEMSEESFYLPGILNKLYALYFVILYTSFYIVGGENGISEDTIYEIMNPRKGRGNPFHIGLHSLKGIARAVRGELKQSKGYMKLYQEINKIGTIEGYAQTLEYVEKDYEEAREWGEAIGYPVRRWLDGRGKRWKAQGKEMDFIKTSEILFSDYKIEKEQIREMKKICMEGKSYYKDLKDLLGEVEDKRLYGEVLYAASRGLDGEVLEELAKKLYHGEVKEKDQWKARMVFDRYRPNGVLMKATTAGHLTAFYYYGRYMQKEYGEDGYLRHYYHSVRKEWGFTEDSDEPADYGGG